MIYLRHLTPFQPYVYSLLVLFCLLSNVHRFVVEEECSAPPTGQEWELWSRRLPEIKKPTKRQLVKKMKFVGFRSSLIDIILIYY